MIVCTIQLGGLLVWIMETTGLSFASYCGQANLTSPCLLSKALREAKTLHAKAQSMHLNTEAVKPETRFVLLPKWVPTSFSKKPMLLVLYSIEIPLSGTLSISTSPENWQADKVAVLISSADKRKRKGSRCRSCLIAGWVRRAFSGKGISPNQWSIVVRPKRLEPPYGAPTSLAVINIKQNNN